MWDLATFTIGVFCFAVAGAAYALEHRSLQRASVRDRRASYENAKGGFLFEKAYLSVLVACSPAPGRSSLEVAMLQGVRYSRDGEAEHTDGEGCQILHEDASCGRHRRDPPEGKEQAGLAGTLVERHEQAEHDPR